MNFKQFLQYTAIGSMGIAGTVMVANDWLSKKGIASEKYVTDYINKNSTRLHATQIGQKIGHHGDIVVSVTPGVSVKGGKLVHRKPSKTWLIDVKDLEFLTADGRPGKGTIVKESHFKFLENAKRMKAGAFYVVKVTFRPSHQIVVREKLKGGRLSPRTTKLYQHVSRMKKFPHITINPVTEVKESSAFKLYYLPAETVSQTFLANKTTLYWSIRPFPSGNGPGYTELSPFTVGLIR